MRTIILTAFYSHRAAPHYNAAHGQVSDGEEGRIIGRYRFRFRFTAAEALLYREFIGMLRNITGQALLSLFKQGVDMMGIDIEEAVLHLEYHRDSCLAGGVAGECPVIKQAPGQNSITPYSAASSTAPSEHEVVTAPAQVVTGQPHPEQDDPKPVADYTTHTGIIKKNSSTEPVPSVPSSSHVVASAASKPAPLDDSVMDSIVGDFLDDL